MYYFANIAAFVFLILSIVYLILGIVSMILRRKNGAKYLISAVVCFFVSGLFMVMIPEKDETASVTHMDNVVAQTEESDIKAEKPKELDKSEDEIVYEDSTITVTYHGLTDVVGNIGMKFTIENKGDHDLTVYPMDTSINDTMVIFLAQHSPTIRPGKKTNGVWLANPEIVGISGYEEVREIEFKLGYDDVTTNYIIIDCD